VWAYLLRVSPTEFPIPNERQTLSFRLPTQSSRGSSRSAKSCLWFSTISFHLPARADKLKSSRQEERGPTTSVYALVFQTNACENKFSVFTLPLQHNSLNCLTHPTATAPPAATDSDTDTNTVASNIGAFNCTAPYLPLAFDFCVNSLLAL